MKKIILIVQNLKKIKKYWQSVFSSVPEVARIPSENKNLCDDIECLAKEILIKLITKQ